VLNTASTDFVHSEKLLEEVDEFEEQTCDTAIMTIASTVVSWV
jgi:hypothetical protein